MAWCEMNRAEFDRLVEDAYLIKALNYFPSKQSIMHKQLHADFISAHKAGQDEMKERIFEILKSKEYYNECLMNGPSIFFVESHLHKPEKEGVRK